MNSDDGLNGMLPDWLKVRQQRIVVDRVEVLADIGFHTSEIGTLQRLLISIELWIDRAPPADDDPAHAWDYDVVVQAVRRLATARRYNLQETLVHAIFEEIGALHGISAIKVSSTKPDIYPDAQGVGVEIASFRGLAP